MEAITKFVISFITALGPVLYEVTKSWLKSNYFTQNLFDLEKADTFFYSKDVSNQDFLHFTASDLFSIESSMVSLQIYCMPSLLSQENNQITLMGTFKDCFSFLY